MCTHVSVRHVVNIYEFLINSAVFLLFTCRSPDGVRRGLGGRLDQPGQLSQWHRGRGPGLQAAHPDGLQEGAFQLQPGTSKSWNVNIRSLQTLNRFFPGICVTSAICTTSGGGLEWSYITTHAVICPDTHTHTHTHIHTHSQTRTRTHTHAHTHIHANSG